MCIITYIDYMYVYNISFLNYKQLSLTQRYNCSDAPLTMGRFSEMGRSMVEETITQDN